MKVFENNYCELTYLEEDKCLVQTWKKFLLSEEFRKIQEETAVLFKEHKCVNFISDTTDAGILKKEDTEWAAQNIIPKLVEAGMKEMNFVVSSNVFTQMTLDNLAKQDNGYVKMNYFPSVTDAHKHIKGEL